MPTHKRIKSSGRPLAALTAGSIEACLYDGEVRPHEELRRTYDITQGMLIRLFTAPKLTLIPHSRVAPTIRSLSSLSPVSNDKTAP